jgi:hypothetical protein
MTKHTGLVVALVAAMALTLATPAPCEACWPSGGYYVEPAYYSAPAYYYPVHSGYYTQMAPSYTYYPSSPTYSYPSGSYSSGYYRGGRGLFSGYYRVGNVIINGRRWGDIGYRYSHADLIRW